MATKLSDPRRHTHLTGWIESLGVYLIYSIFMWLTYSVVLTPAAKTINIHDVQTMHTILPELLQTYKTDE